MITTTVKLILQAAMILSFGYLALAFFQKLFCKDISTLDYSKFIEQRKKIWANFKRAFKSQKYRSYLLMCGLCLFGFYNSLHELSLDWELHDKLILWQVWAIGFCFALYLGNSNMKLKLLYDISGKDHKKTSPKIIPMENSPNTAELKKTLTNSIGSVINYKNAYKNVLVVLIVAILCAGYGFYAMWRSKQEIEKQKDYSANRDSIITELNMFKDSINLALDNVTRQRDSLLIIRTAKDLEREDILKKPIDYSNKSERERILNEMLKEAGK